MPTTHEFRQQFGGAIGPRAYSWGGCRGTEFARHFMYIHGETRSSPRGEILRIQ